MRHMNSDIPVALGVTAVGALFLFQASLIDATYDTLIGPRLVPMTISGLIIALAVLQLALALFARNDRDATGTLHGADMQEPATNTISVTAAVRMVAIIVLGAAYIWLFAAAGYLISTAVILAALLHVFGMRSLSRVALLTVCGAAAYYVVFIKLMGIHDPAGWLIDLGQFGF